MDKALWRQIVFISTGFFGVGAASGYLIGFLAAVWMGHGHQ